MTISLLLQVISVVDQEALVCPLMERLLCGSSPLERSVLSVCEVGGAYSPSCLLSPSLSLHGLFLLTAPLAAVQEDPREEDACQLALILLNVLLANTG